MPFTKFPSIPPSDSNRPQTMIWVGAGKTPVASTDRDGSVENPFLTVQEAVDWAALQTESSFQIMVAPGTYGDLNIPADKTFIFETSSVFYGAIIGNLTVTASAGPNNLVQFKNFAINNIDYIGTPGDTVIVALIHTCVVGGNVTNSGGVNAIFISAAALEPTSGFTACTIVGTVNIGQTGTFSAANSDVQAAVTAGAVKFVDCNVPISINCYGNNVQIHESEFQIGNPVVTFLSSLGTVFFDSETVINFGLNGGDIINGSAFTQGAGPQLFRAESGSFNSMDSAILSNPFSIQPAVGTQDKDTVGIVHPAVAGGKMALLWQSGELIPGIGLGTGVVYYRDQSTGLLTSTPTTQKIGVSDGQNFLVDIESGMVETFLISSLNSFGFWYSGEFVGPNYDPASAASPIVSGFARATKNGFLRNFKFTNSQPPITTITVDLYQAPNNNPSLLSYTGISITINTGDYIANNSVDTLTVNENDIFAFYLPSGGVYNPNALTITADFINF